MLLKRLPSFATKTRSLTPIGCPGYHIENWLFLDDPNSYNHDDDLLEIKKRFAILSERLIEQIHSQLKTGGTVLVTCSMGVSRSPTLVLMYLAWLRKKKKIAPQFRS